MNKAIPFIMSFATLLLFAGVFFHASTIKSAENITELTRWTMTADGDTSSVLLPAIRSCQDMQPDVVLTTVISPEDGDYLYLKAVYTPVEVYADGRRLFAYGQEGTYPAFLLDPPTVIKLLPIPGADHPLTLTLRFCPPTQRSSMTLYPVLQGDSGDLLVHLFSRMGFSLLFSIIQIALGVLLLLIAFLLLRFDGAGRSILWLGVFSVLTGVWMLGECNLTGIFIQNPPLLYLMAFVGMFTLVIPLIRCQMALIKPRQTVLVLLRTACALMELAVTLAVLLQLLGIAAFSRTMYLFHVLIPLAFLLSAACVLWEAFSHKSQFAIRFLFPVLVLAVFSLLEVVNYHLLCLRLPISFFFQLGVLLFIGMMCVLCGHYIRHTFLTQAKNRQLSYELSMAELQIESRKKQYAILSETAASVRAQRHDLRHHLAVIRGYHSQHMDQKLIEYLDMLSASLPVDPEKRLCENDAVNAVALYYLTMAEKAGIASIRLQLCIPSDTGQVQETDLCVIIGNLLENAVAACREAAPKQSFLHMQSRLQYGILTITMDNYCPSVHPGPDGSFLSQKPGGGTGLRSVRSIAEKYGGSARFEAKGKLFFSSVYLYLEKQEDQPFMI